MVSAVILAAGGSTRMGRPKQFLPLQGQPLIAHTLRAFETCGVIDEIVIVAREEDHPVLREIVQRENIAKCTAIVVGGATRQQSAYAGVACCPSADLVAVHDGARPLITPSVIERVVQAAFEHGAAAAAVRAKDTVKIADDRDMVVMTPDRSTVWNVQTPQICKREIYERAWAHAQKMGLQVTDDCQMIEAIGQQIKLVEGSYANIKVTTPEDLPVAEELLK